MDQGSKRRGYLRGKARLQASQACTRCASRCLYSSCCTAAVVAHHTLLCCCYHLCVCRTLPRTERLAPTWHQTRGSLASSRLVRQLGGVEGLRGVGLPGRVFASGASLVEAQRAVRQLHTSGISCACMRSHSMLATTSASHTVHATTTKVILTLPCAACVCPRPHVLCVFDFQAESIRCL
jgi:hypothetical protein